MSLRRLAILIRREALATLRDPFTVTILVLVPLFALVLFSSILSTEVEGLSLGVLDMSDGAASRRVVAELAAQDTFVPHRYATREAIDSALRSGEIGVAVIIPPDFERSLESRGPGKAAAEIQVLYDGGEAVLADNSEAFLKSLVTATSLNLTGATAALEALPPAAAAAGGLAGATAAGHGAGAGGLAGGGLAGGGAGTPGSASGAAAPGGLLPEAPVGASAGGADSSLVGDDVARAGAGPSAGAGGTATAGTPGGGASGGSAGAGPGGGAGSVPGASGVAIPGVGSGLGPGGLASGGMGAVALSAGAAGAAPSSLGAGGPGTDLAATAASVSAPVAAAAAARAARRAPVQVVPRALYNPRLDGKPYMVAGVFGFVLSFSTTLIIAVSVVNERFAGTFEQLQVTPATSIEILLGKVLPLGAVFSADVVLMMITAWVLFGIWPAGSALLFVVLSAFYMIVSLSLGLLMSATSATAAEAVSKTVLLSTPLIQLSGFAFPTRNMATPFRWFSELIPATHYIRVSRAIYLRGEGLLALLPELAIIAVMGLALGLLALRAIGRRA